VPGKRPRPEATDTTVDDFFNRVETRRHAWPAGRADLHWHLLFDLAVIEQHLVTPYTPITHQPGLQPVPSRWIHMTVLHGGPIADYRSGEIEAITELVTDRCATIDPPQLTIDRPMIGRVAIECAARPGAPVRQLWELTARVDAEVTGGRHPLLPATYYPHISIAYGIAGDHRPSRTSLKAMLSDIPGEPTMLRATSLALVAQAHDRRHITWTPIATALLGGTPR
jgi:hypothetical protein